jgi:hypothetical protein
MMGVGFVAADKTKLPNYLSIPNCIPENGVSCFSIGVFYGPFFNCPSMGLFSWSGLRVFGPSLHSVRKVGPSAVISQYLFSEISQAPLTFIFFRAIFALIEMPVSHRFMWVELRNLLCLLA